MHLYLLVALLQGVPANAPEVDLNGMADFDGGLFTMGTPDDLPVGRYGDGWYVNQTPAHEVMLGPFRLDYHEVDTQAFSLFLTHACGAACFDERMPIVERDGVYAPVSNWTNVPITYVDHRSATWYCRWAGKRLPTEAEWEFAAAGSEGRNWPWPNDVGPRCSYSNFAYDGGRCTDAPQSVVADERGLTPEGVSHLAGNVSEWVSDVYAPYSAAATTNPTGPNSGAYHVLKGGSFLTPRIRLRPQSRRPARAEQRSPDVGFRCAWDDTLIDGGGVVRGDLRAPEMGEGAVQVHESTWEPVVTGLTSPTALFASGRMMIVTTSDGVRVLEEGREIAHHRDVDVDSYFALGDEMIGVDVDSARILSFSGTDMRTVLEVDNLTSATSDGTRLLVSDGVGIYIETEDDALDTVVSDRRGIQSLARSDVGLLWTEMGDNGPALMRLLDGSDDVDVVIESGTLPNPLKVWGIHVGPDEQVMVLVGFDGWPFSALLCRLTVDDGALECLGHSPPKASDIHIMDNSVVWRTQFGLYRWRDGEVSPLGEPLGPGGVHWALDGVYVTHSARGQILYREWIDL